MTKKDKYIRKRLEDKEDQEENIGDLLKITQKSKDMRKNIQYTNNKNKNKKPKDRDFGIRSV